MRDIRRLAQRIAAVVLADPASPMRDLIDGKTPIVVITKAEYDELMTSTHESTRYLTAIAALLAHVRRAHECTACVDVLDEFEVP